MIHNVQRVAADRRRLRVRAGEDLVRRARARSGMGWTVMGGKNCAAIEEAGPAQKACPREGSGAGRPPSPDTGCRW